MGDSSISTDSLVKRFNEWLTKDNAGPWSFIRLTDCQKESLLWIGLSFIFAVVFWKGIPKKYEEVLVWDLDEYGKRQKGPNGRWKTKTKWMFRYFKYLPVLQPIKFLTVLYHEISHALVGLATGGRPILILVDWNEGGVTFFDPPPARQPSVYYTLPAGYIGSCIIGCAFTFCGFDAVASKYAAVAYGVMAIVSLFICLLIFPKLFFHHNRYWFKRQWAKLRGQGDKTEELDKETKDKDEREKNHSKASQEDEDDKALASDKEMMASIELIGLTTLVIGALLAVSWVLYDSLYLRFVILFLGVINSLYAIWDIFLDGMKYGKSVVSDCTEMARKFNSKKSKHGRKGHTTGFYARRWLAAEIVLFVGTIIAALAVWRDTISEQALRSRSSFWATSNHYTPSGLFSSASDSAQEWFD